MHRKGLVCVVGFWYGITSVAAQCDEVRTGWGKDLDNELGMSKSCTRIYMLNSIYSFSSH